MMLGKSLRSYRRLFEGFKQKIETNRDSSDLQSVIDQLDELLLGLDTLKPLGKVYPK